ncbi:hypothetical protein [Myxosarcina sp. GI1]|uniref:hypothetical protein n=1 Tax=Myxosarcina sp. GI1 TaxID=1541065 RepID=UPI000907AE03|nr:hypothetical protein [Myxosarcina sp. GI1]
MGKRLAVEVTRKLLVKAISIIAITISACANHSPSAIDTSGLVEVADITQNIESYIGRSVLVRNDIIETIGERGFILDKDRAFAGDNILVISISNLPFELTEENTPEVLVGGKVERFTLSDLQQRYNLNLDSNLYTPYENEPVIIAESLILSPDPEDLTKNPEAYYNKPLAVEGELEDLKSYGVFELDEEQAFGGEDLIVVQPKPRIKLKQEQMAIVYGKLRPFIVVELERDYDLGWDLSVRQEIEAEYSQKPVLVADKIQLLKP